MEKTVKITGMMCPHCENRVKKALEAVPGIEKAEVSHETGTANLTFTAETDDTAIKAAVENAGYKMEC